MLTCTVNGEARTLPQPLTVAQLLERLGYDRGRVAVEVNGEVVPAVRHAEQTLAPADRVEIVTLVGGGSGEEVASDECRVSREDELATRHAPLATLPDKPLVIGKFSFRSRLITGTGNSDEFVDLMVIRTDYPYQTLRYWSDGKRDEPPALDLWNVYVPTDRAQRRNHTYGLIMVQKPQIPGLMHLLWPVITLFTEGIFRQDRAIVEAEQRAFEAQGSDRNNEVFPLIQSLKTLLARRGVPLSEVSAGGQ